MYTGTSEMSKNVQIYRGFSRFREWRCVSACSLTNSERLGRSTAENRGEAPATHSRLTVAVFMLDIETEWPLNG